MSDANKPPGPPGTGGNENSYFENDVLKPEFVRREDMEPVAEQMARDGLNMTQLNRFFRHCRRIEFRLRRKETTWDETRPEVQKLSAHAADAYGKGQKVPASFKKFIDDNVSRTRTERDFIGGFMEHFETLMGFASLYAKKGQRG